MKQVHPRPLYERGQASLEVLFILPLALGTLLLGLAIAVLWHAHGLSAHLALEGASRNGAQPGSGSPFVAEKKASVAPTFEIGPHTRIIFAGVEGSNVVFSVNGRAVVPWAPWGLNFSTAVQTGVVSPVWDFQP